MRLKELNIEMIEQEKKPQLKEEGKEIVGKSGGGNKEKKDAAALRDRVASQLKEIKRFRDAFTPNTIDVNELVED